MAIVNKESKKKQRKASRLEEFGAVPKGFPEFEMSMYMRRLGAVIIDNETFKKMLIEGSEIFGPAFMFYVEMAWSFALGRDEAARRAASAAMDYHQVFNEVIAMDIVQDPAKLVAHLAPKVYPSKQKHLYVIRSFDGAYKIGITQHVATRMHSLNTGSPHRVELIHTISCNDVAGLERQLHKQFAEKRVNGEWYLLNDEDVAYIKSLEITDNG